MTLGRIVRSADYERVLGSPSRVRSSHFAVHHVAASPSQKVKPAKALSTAQGELSTGDAQQAHKAVDEVAADVPNACWLGAVVPKRNAKRSVTRSLLKRQIRAAFDGQPLLPPGLWVVRLRAPFDGKLFPSAASDALRAAAREELAQLVGRVLSKAPKA
jgi:ribonuclease P protein component